MQRNKRFDNSETIATDETTLIMAQDAPKCRFLSLIFLVSCISKSFHIKQTVANEKQFVLIKSYMTGNILIQQSNSGHRKAISINYKTLDFTK